MTKPTETNIESATHQTLSLTIVSLSFFIGMFITVFVSLVGIGKKLKLIGVLADCSAQIAEGHVDMDMETTAKDEVGVLAKAFKKMLDSIKKQAELLDRMAAGDFSENIPLRSEQDRMNIAINNLVNSYNDTMSEILNVTTQVKSGSKQIADGSQILAQGSNEQSAAIELLTSSINAMEKKTKDNSQMARQAAELANTIKDNAEKGSDQMAQMVQAVKEINDASNSISKVIKVIDDIAFQTNILALNAAVEAARAGQHGKGFAVVADEVRGLAAKSAEAAKDTESLISNSMEKAQLGQQIADKTAASLNEIALGINKSNFIVGEIASSSEEQSAEISGISRGVEQVAKVVQQNSATAQESSSASEEMSNQAVVLDRLIHQFKLKNSGLIGIGQRWSED